VDVNQPQPGIDLQKLETVQRGVQIAATLALVVTLALCGLAWWKLEGINRELVARQTALTNADEELKKREARIADLDARIDADEKHLAKAHEALRAIEAQPTPLKGSAVPPGPPDASQIPARVYIQIFDEAKRPRARELQKALESRGFVVPGIENVGNTRAVHQSISDLRFYGGATDSPDVAAITEIAGQFGLMLKPISLTASTGVRPRHYELWLGSDFR
jgi:hypothetical protein